MSKRCYGCMRVKGTDPRCAYCGYLETDQNAYHQLPVGTVLQGKYQIGRVLGQGGFGITYLGWDTQLETPVAIKEYYPSSQVSRIHGSTTVATNNGTLQDFQQGKERFLKEAQTLAKLRHLHNIVQVHSFFAENNTVYIVMEYVEGITLQEHIRRRGGRLSPEETFGILRPILQAMSQVHQAGMVHRDISPDNIMLQNSGVVKLLDFGTARDVDPNAGQLTHSTQAVLKRGFAPVEQYSAGRAIDQRADEYALCATIYYCLTGRVPMDALDRLVDRTDIPWSSIPGLSSRQVTALSAGTAIRAEDRYPDVKTLESVLFSPMPVPPPVPADKPKKKAPPRTIPKTESFTDTPVQPQPAPKPTYRLVPILAVLLLMAVCVGLFFWRQQRNQVRIDTSVETQGTAAASSNRGAPTPAPAAAEEVTVYHVGVALYLFNDNFINLYRQELETLFRSMETDTVKYDITFVDSHNDMAEQTTQVETFISQGMDLIILNLVQTTAAETLINKVADAGIPLILVNREPLGTNGRESYPAIVNNPSVCYVGSDSRQAGTCQGEILLDLDDKGDINGDGVVSYVMIVGDPNNVDAQYRTEFAVKALTDSGIKVDCLVQNAGYWDQTKGYEITAAALAQYGTEVEVIFCNNDSMALGAVKAITEAGHVVGEDIYLLGIDAMDPCKEMVREGTMTGTVLNDYTRLALTTMDVAVSTLKGIPMENYYWVDYVKIDAAYFR